MVLYFYLCRGELPGCPLRLQRGVSPNAHRLALLQSAKQASYGSGSCGYLCIALGSGGTFACLLLISLFRLTLFLFLIHSSDLQEVFCLAMLIIVQPSFLALNTKEVGEKCGHIQMAMAQLNILWFWKKGEWIPICANVHVWGKQQVVSIIGVMLFLKDQ